MKMVRLIQYNALLPLQRRLYHPLSCELCIFADSAFELLLAHGMFSSIASSLCSLNCLQSLQIFPKIIENPQKHLNEHRSKTLDNINQLSHLRDPVVPPSKSISRSFLVPLFFLQSSFPNGLLTLRKHLTYKPLLEMSNHSLCRFCYQSH